MFENLQDAIKHYAKCMKCPMSEAKADAEREIALIMKEENCSREFAESTWIENQEELDASELDKLDKEAKANGATKIVAQGEKPKQKRAPRKPNEEKHEIIAYLEKALDKTRWCDVEILSHIDNVLIVKDEREIAFRLGENEYSITLTCHRKKKE